MKFIFSLLVAFIVGSLSCSAADLDSVDYYVLSSVESLSPTVNSALDYGVSLASATSWDTSDQSNLQNIRDALVSTPSYAGSGSIYRNVDSIQDWIATIGSATVSSSSTASTLLSNLEDINTWLNSSGISDSLSDLESGLVGTSNSVLWYAREIYNDTSELHNIYLSASSSALSLEEINDAVQNDYDSLKELLKSIWSDTDSIYTNLNEYNPRMTNYLDLLSAYFCSQLWSFPLVDLEGNIVGSYENKFFSNFFEYFINASYDGLNYESRDRTLYSRLKQLQEVLASDDDKVLAESQKANREEIEDSFLNGSSGSTSLGVSDFGDLADVGGTINDSLSLDGNASISSFISGLAAADSAGQGWFSEETRSQLDAVSSTVMYSLRDPDPYNMAGWEDRYYWLLGDDE